MLKGGHRRVGRDGDGVSEDGQPLHIFALIRPILGRQRLDMVDDLDGLG